MIFFYKTIVNILGVVVLPFLPFLYLFSEKRRSNMLPRLGIKTGLVPKKPGEKRIWVHALSVGEVKSSLPFVNALKEQYKEVNIIFTASTKTGFDMAAELFFKRDDYLADQLGYFPLDIGISVKKIQRIIEPDAVVIVETDLWPTFLYELGKKKIPVLLINARLSKRSLNGYLFFRKFSALFFSSLTLIMAQTILDKNRFQRLGIDKDKILVTGNIKFDHPHEDVDEDVIKGILDRFRIKKQTRVFVAGSTHEGEEKILCRVYKKVKNFFPDFFMILAPRDPKRCLKILSYFESNDVQAVLMSAMDGSKMDKSKACPDVVLVDKMGELFQLYSICDVAFIGGSMVGQGGHNPLEPAAFSKPILFGSDMSDFFQISTLLLEHGGAKKVMSEKDLGKELENLLQSSKAGQQMGKKNVEIFLRHSGAVQKIIKNMERLHIV